MCKPCSSTPIAVVHAERKKGRDCSGDGWKVFLSQLPCLPPPPDVTTKKPCLKQCLCLLKSLSTLLYTPNHLQASQCN